jgi:hypothetical protein
MNPCPDSKICNTPNEDPTIDSYCKEKETIPFKKILPSLPCKEQEECYSLNCHNDVCQGKSDGSECISPFECNYGRTCRRNLNEVSSSSRCLEPIKEGGQCEIDTDCVLEC